MRQTTEELTALVQSCAAKGLCAFPKEVALPAITESGRVKVCQGRFSFHKWDFNNVCRRCAVKKQISRPVIDLATNILRTQVIAGPRIES
jgi:hypothetical protein